MIPHETLRARSDKTRLDLFYIFVIFRSFVIFRLLFFCFYVFAMFVIILT